VKNPTLHSEGITSGLRAAIGRTDRQVRFYRHHAIVARHAGNVRAEVQRLAAAARFEAALARLEDLGSERGLLTASCKYAAAGEFCYCS
jgi:hypothetical protein